MSSIVKRADLTKVTMDKFIGQDFEWRGCDCVKVARSHLVRAGFSLPKMPNYSDPRTAIRALKSRGWETLEDMLDEFLPRIPPASMLVGDLAIMDAGEGEPLGGLVISAGRHVFGFHEDSTKAVVILPHQINAAWSIGI